MPVFKRLLKLVRALWRTRREPVVIVPARIMRSINEAPVDSGVCCCGASMRGMSGSRGWCDNHTSRDQWDYMLEGINEELERINA